MKYLFTASCSCLTMFVKYVLLSIGEKVRQKAKGCLTLATNILPNGKREIVKYSRGCEDIKSVY